ncbi:MAG: diacylglycerol kinase family protein [Syntrophomonadaceae bacterium]|jgi:diacylglycerol kinase|nr:diacylglycerol kinase family protein [Syntrophomonadaceae bacterium]
MKRRSFQQSMVSAVSGLFMTVRSERNMKIHLLAAFLATTLGLALGINRIEWGLLCLTIFLVLMAEVANTALERVVDLVTAEYHPLARTAKNAAAGAVLLSAINALIMAGIIFGPYLCKR